MRFEVFTVVKIYVTVFWVMMPCGVAVGYQRLRGPHHLCIQGAMGATRPSETLVS